jgi:hypothetical protein
MGQTTKRKKKSPEQRGFMPIEEVGASLRALAAQLEQENKGRLAKVNLDIWYEDSESIKSGVAVETKGGDAT